AVDGDYPLVGTLALEGGGDLHAALARRDGTWGAVAEASTLNRLNIKVGERVMIGDQSYVVRDVIATEPDRSANVFTLGPRVMVAYESLASTGLVQPGSL